MSRDQLDRYYTPPALAAACVEVLRRRHGLLDFGALRVLEPSSGNGAWLHALSESYRVHARDRFSAWGLSLLAVDIDPAAEAHAVRHNAAFTCADFLSVDLVTPAQWVIGNPPFKDAQRHVERALQLAPRVAFILRAGFLGSAKRQAWWDANQPEAVYIISPRPSFTDGGTDAGEYMLAVWERGRSASQLRWLSWDKEGA